MQWPALCSLSVLKVISLFAGALWLKRTEKPNLSGTSVQLSRGQG